MIWVATYLWLVGYLMARGYLKHMLRAGPYSTGSPLDTQGFPGFVEVLALLWPIVVPVCLLAEAWSGARR